MARAALALVAATVVALTAGYGYATGHSDLGCNNCHVVHRAQTGDTPGPLWNGGNLSAENRVFTLYSSPSFDALGTDIGQPNGATKACLSCHDGSNSSMSSSNLPNFFANGDLSGSHPVSFTYDSSLAFRARAGGLRDPVSTSSGLGSTIAKDLLDSSGRMQCTSCHDAHGNSGNPYNLRYPYDPQANTDGILCRVCHNK